MTMLAGCQPSQVRQAEERSAQVAFDPALGQETIVHNGIIYQTVGEPMEGDESNLVAVGTSEGYVLYQLPGGGAGLGGRNLLFIRTTDGRFQALQPVANAPAQRTMPEEGQEPSMPHDMP